MFDNVDWGATILTLVVAFIGSGVISTLILKKHEKDLAVAKEMFDLKLTEIKAKSESNTYATNLQYEHEFNIYKKLWSDLTDQHENTYTFIKWLNDDNFFDVIDEDKVKQFWNHKEKMVSIIYRNEPFVNEKMRDCLHSLRGKLMSGPIDLEFFNKRKGLEKRKSNNKAIINHSDTHESLKTYYELINNEMNNLKSIIIESLDELRR